MGVLVLTKALITGGLGFIGFHLAKHLQEKGDKVIICDNQFRGKIDEEVKIFLKKNGVEYINMDMADKKDFEKLDNNYDAVYHLAAINGTKYFYQIPEEVLRVNLLSTINLLEWIKDTSCKDMLFSSSSEVYSGTILKFGWKIPTEEDVPLCIEDVSNPRYSYGGSKIAGELLFLNYGRKYSLNTRIVRFHNIYGERMGYEHVIPEFFKRIFDKVDPFPIHGGNETRSFIYVMDGVRAARLVMENEKTKDEIINIGNEDEEITIKDLSEKMFEITGVNPKIELKESLKGSVPRRCPSIEKLKKLTGYTPEVSLHEGLQRTYKWYKQDYQKKLTKDGNK